MSEDINGKVVAVTGATGHLGNVLVRQLLERGAKVRVVVLPGDSMRPLYGLDVQIIEADITNPEMLRGVFTGCSIVFHTAGLIRLGNGALRQMRLVNVEGTRNVVEAAFSQGVGRLVYTSSIHAFADKGAKVIDETATIDPDMTFSDYSTTKAEATLLVRKAVKEGRDCVILYPVGISGPNDFQESELTRFMINFRAGKHRIIPRGGYFFIDVRDAARFHIDAAEKAPSGSEYIISTEYASTADLVRFLQPAPPLKVFYVPGRIAVWAGAIGRLFGSRETGRFVLGEHAAHELRQTYDVSSEKAAKEFGSPRIGVEVSFRDAVAWLKSRGQGE